MATSEEILKVQDSARHGGLFFCSFVLFLHGMGEGTGMGYGGLVLPRHVGRDSAFVGLTVDEGNWFVVINPLANLVGVLLSIPASEKMGRKPVFVVSNILSILGYLVMYFAPSFLLLVLGGVTQCLGMGLGSMCPIMLLSEISIVKLRGPLTGVSQTSACVGTLMAASLCIFLPMEYLSLVLAGHSFLVIVLMVFVPESPQWLVRKGKDEDAIKSIKTLRGKKYPGVDMEIIEIMTCVKERDSISKGSAFGALKTRSFTTPLLVFTVIFMILGTSGIDTILFYGPTIFASIDIGIPTSVLSTLPWIGFSIGYAASSFLMAKINRKPQYIIFATIMGLSMLTFGTILKFIDEGTSPVLAILLVASLQVGSIAYGAGVGSIPYTMVGEVFTPEYKTVGTCVVQSVRCITVFIFIKSVPSMLICIGIHGVFIIHGSVLIFSVIYVWCFVPETKGKTLTELCSIYTK